MNTLNKILLIGLACAVSECQVLSAHVSLSPATTLPHAAVSTAGTSERIGLASNLSPSQGAIARHVTDPMRSASSVLPAGEWS